MPDFEPATPGETTSTAAPAATQSFAPGAQWKPRVNPWIKGPVLHNAVLRGSAFVSFSDCYFSNDNHQDPGYSIVAPSGKLQVHHSTFDARSRLRNPGNTSAGKDIRRQPGSIHLKTGLKSAIIEGNNGYYGVNIRNDIGDKAILRDNEPFQPEQPAEK